VEGVRSPIPLNCAPLSVLPRQEAIAHIDPGSERGLLRW
jgi:hypothetical protein